MFLRVLTIIALLLPAAASAKPHQSQNQIPLVACSKGSGTAFRVGPHTLATARHVADAAPCKINGLAMQVSYESPDSDFALLSDARVGRALKIDCGGFVKGRPYIALGHARGVPKVIPVELVALGLKHQGDGQQILVGLLTVIPGQSGGPIIDARTGAAVGVATAENFEMGISTAVELKGTVLCAPADSQPLL